MMDSPFEAAFRASAASPVDGKPLGLRLLACLLVPPAIVLAATLPASEVHGRPARPAEGFAPVLPQAPAQRPADGAIFNVAAGYTGLAEGRRAHAVGDPLTIILTEQLNASKSAAGKTQKTGAFNVVPPTAGPLSFLDPNALKASGGSSFNGQGNASQTSTLGGEVSVTIAEVRPNGTALVVGEKRLLLSQGQEWVQLSGIVRLGDIDADNRVRSTQVADARVTYTGNGAVGRASREGWLSKFFGAISPF
ncbi:flagellar biosynthesis protein FlgH [Novosphingobium fuchskuhlense]|uniref:Flagellar L-ring protein n=1 Tax=Novosphingobium fuchskuhlense TaxID=1117702 RepID=A0A117UXL9_9SPHN|nr:flagellar basal body L-ring protein FlgH [Novosphingobium fuchskuhlense]KUR72731.1 flagellar biosynthesis protein FlgH [Novosphingobium fuchskuhlense]